MKASHRKSVGIVGAGAAGLCSAKHMIEAGYDVTLYEIGSHVGGMWVYGNDNGLSSAYKTLHINTARDLTAFRDFPFDRKVQAFPDHRDMAAYLAAYAQHFDISRRIRFKTRVTVVRAASDYSAARPRWQLTTDTGTTDIFDAIIVASGHLSKPEEVPMLRDGFTGEYLHSHAYKDPAKFASKRVCVVGVGNSSCDIASDLCTTAERTVLVGRSTPLIVPKHLFGRPFWDVMKPFYKPWVPPAIRTRAIKIATWMVHGNMADLGFAPSAKKVHATSNASIVSHIKYTRVTVKQGITAIDGQRVTFNDGSAEEFDTLIAATGYALDLPFIPPEIARVENHSLDLYLRMVPPDWRSFYFVGFINSDSALNWIAEGQIRWLREIELGRAALPDKAGMLAEIAARKAWVRRTFKDSPRHGIEVEHIPYFGDLRRAMKEAQRRAGRPIIDVGIGADRPSAFVDA